jgi:AcrR family transcriptional regulator
MNERSFSFRSKTLRPRRRRPPGRPSRRSGRRDTRRAILEAAADLFLQSGYHGASIRRIADRAGVSPAAVYNHFPGKERLYFELLVERAPQTAAAQVLGGLSGGDTRRLTRQAMAALRDTLHANWGNLRLVLIELLEWQGKHAGGLLATFWPGVDRFIGRLERSRPGLRRLPRPLVARVFLGLALSYAITAALLRRLPGFRESDGDWAQLADIFLYGVAARPAAPGRRRRR